MHKAGLHEPLLGARVHGENDRHIGRDGVDGSEKCAECFQRIDIGRTMERQHSEVAPVLTARQPKLLANPRVPCNGQEVMQRIDHDVANEMVRGRPSLSRWPMASSSVTNR